MEWENIYKNHAHLSIWPWSDLVSYVVRYARPDRKGMRVLEVGFGAGANIPFFAKFQADFYGIDGSQTIVEVVRKEYPQYCANLICGDFTREIPFDEGFDLIVDRSAIIQNDTAAMRAAVSLIYTKLRNGGKFIGIDWFSTKHSAFAQKDCAVVDDYTRASFKSGYFCGLGNVHFSNRAHLIELLSNANFEIEKLEHKTYEDYSLENEDIIYILASWNFVATRKG
jgi:SAM-dependent methyltransferase